MREVSGGLIFPFKEDFQQRSLKRAITVEQVLSSSIKLFLLTEKYQRVGNSIGSFVPTLIHELKTEDELLSLSDELRQELTEQFPGVIFLQTDIVKDEQAILEKGIVSYNIQIKYGTPFTDVVELSIPIIAN